MEIQNTIRLASITKESIVDGEGLRYVLWSQGCHHNCKGCFNPHTHSFTGGQLYEISSILQEIRANPLLQGITCSGGDPFEQPLPFAHISKEVKKMGLDVWCYTGYSFEHLLSHQDQREDWKIFLSYIDVLVDGRFEEEKKDLTLLFKGSSNQRIIDVQKSLHEKSIILWSNSYLDV